MNHLYVQTAFLGDLLLSVPTLKQIRYWSPKSELTVVCRRGYGQFLADLGLCDEVIELHREQKSEFAQTLKGRTFDTLFCPHQSVNTHKMIKAIRAETKIGYRRWWNQSYFDHRVERRLDWPEAIRQLQLLTPVYDSMALKVESFEHHPDGIPQWSEMLLPNLDWKSTIVQDLINQKAQGFKVDQPFVCLAPGSVWPTKRWIKDHFIKVATQLARQNFQILVIGAPEERELCEKVQSQVPNSFSLAGLLNISQSLMVLSKAKGLICNDSGAMHMASLLHLPTIAIFGPTVPALGYKPWNPKAELLEDESLLCRPCGQHGARYCPIGTHRCMLDIRPSQVSEVASVLFSK